MPSSIALAVFWAAVIVCAVAQLAIMRGVLRRHRERPLVEVAWAAAPAVVLALVFMWTWHAIHSYPRGTESPAPGAVQSENPAA